MTTANKKQLLLPSVALGLSCGIGFFVAQESYRQRKWNWSSLKNATQKLVNHQSVPWWLLAAGTRGLYPLALWLVLKEVIMVDDKFDIDRDSTRKEKDVSEEKSNVNLDTRDPESLVLQPAAPPETRSRSASISSNQSPRQLELLVHNVSHTDMVLSLDAHKEGGYCLCRPRFSTMDLYMRRILNALPSSNPETVSFPRYERSEEDPRHTIVTPRPSRQKQLPTGFRLPPSQDMRIPADELANFRIRGRDAHQVEDVNKATANISLDYVFFPLLAALLPKWDQQIAQKYSYSTEVKKVLILVSGVGTPRNWTHSIAGNSTEICSALMERFVKLLHPDVTVVRIHSETNIFRYDENILFAKHELKPIVDSYRDAHACGKPYPDEAKDVVRSNDDESVSFSPDWKKSLSLSVSFADGSPARIHAIQATLRPYRPSYFHFWQLKSFWHDTKIVDDDIEMHSFEEMETVPAMEASAVADSDTRMVIQEMQQYRNDFLEQYADDISQFWLRKTKKPVLAVLLVQIKDQAPKLYRGTNMEVSMPTGSLCAERNVIGTALADNPGLKRQDLKMVAVLAIPLAQKVEDSAAVVNNNMPRNMSFSSIVREGESSHHDVPEEDWVIPGGGDMERELTERVSNHSSASKFSSDNKPSPPGTPVRRIPLYPIMTTTTTATTSETSDNKLIKHRITMGSRTQKRTVLVHSENDLNPLLPCGACNEWLKKISESNPYFSVVTFTDAECAGVYVTPCQE